MTEYTGPGVSRTAAGKAHQTTAPGGARRLRPEEVKAAGSNSDGRVMVDTGVVHGESQRVELHVYKKMYREKLGDLVKESRRMSSLSLTNEVRIIRSTRSTVG